MIKKVPIIAMLVVLVFTTKVNAQEIKEMKATAYCLQGQTASGTQTRFGMCAGKKEWIGKQVFVFKKEDNKYLGMYAVEDTGGDAIKSGAVIDIWLPNEQMCKDFGTKDVIVVIGD